MRMHNIKPVFRQSPRAPREQGDFHPTGPVRTGGRYAELRQRAAGFVILARHHRHVVMQGQLLHQVHAIGLGAAKTAAIACDDIGNAEALRGHGFSSCASYACQAARRRSSMRVRHFWRNRNKWVERETVTRGKAKRSSSGRTSPPTVVVALL